MTSVARAELVIKELLFVPNTHMYFGKILLKFT